MRLFKQDDYHMSLEEIGDMMNIAPRTVSRIQEYAMTKARAYCRRHGIRFEDFVNSLSKR